jgi:hypothetical protein
VTADHRAARGEPLCSTRCPAPESDGGRGLAAAVAQHRGEEGGVLAQTPPTTPRPGACAQGVARGLTFAGQAYRAVVVHARRPAQRRQTPLRRAWQAAAAARAATGREAAPQASCCRADAEAAATQVRARPRASPQVEVGVEQPPRSGPGRPRLQVMRPARAEGLARQTPETAGGVLLTTGPPTGERAPRAGEVRQADQEPHGIEPTGGVLTAPRLVTRLFRKTPERREALGKV